MNLDFRPGKVAVAEVRVADDIEIFWELEIIQLL